VPAGRQTMSALPRPDLILIERGSGHAAMRGPDALQLSLSYYGA
jgi:hypothetical protein